MGGPYRACNLKVTITSGSTSYVLQGITNLDTNLKYDGEAEAYYGSRTRKQSAGVKTITFSMTRMFYTDNPYQDLLINLFNDETVFTLTTSLLDKDGNDIADTAVVLTNCRLYGWKEVCGDVDSVIGEEVTGQATDWTLEGVGTPSQINNIEGDYTSWTHTWTISSNELSNIVAMEVYEDANKLLIYGTIADYAIFNLTTGALVTKDDSDNQNLIWQDGSDAKSFRRYFCSIRDNGVNTDLQIFKDGTVIDTINITAIDAEFTNADTALISKDGKYIIITKWSTGAKMALFTGVGTDPITWDGTTLVGPQGEQGPSGNPEGDYTDWTEKWKRSVVDDIPDMQSIFVYEVSDRIMILGADDGIITYDLATGTTVLEGPTHCRQPWYFPNRIHSVHDKYLAFITSEYGDDDGSKWTLMIYKDGIVVKTVDITNTYGWTPVSGNPNYTNLVYCAISNDGKYIAVMSYERGELILFEGS